MGSKKRLLNLISENIKGDKVIDACSGSGVVTQHLTKNKKVISCDILYFPGAIINGSIGVSNKINEIKTLLGKANSLKGKQGFFYNNYTNDRTYFTEENAAILDEYREFCENIPDFKLKNYMLYVGMESLSRAANTTGLQACFLKKFKTPAARKIEFRLEDHYEGESEFHRTGIIEFLENYQDFDTIYLDPPYNQRQYGKTYHLYETFIRNDNPEIFGKTGQRKILDEPSKFCKLYECENEFKKLVSLCKNKTILISYNSEGNLPKEKFINLFNAECIEFDFRRYKSLSHEKENKVKEYLFVINT